MKLHPNQQAAIDRATDTNGPRLVLIQGGAGTGKTTIISRIVSSLDRVSLCAPTGKAAARMREATGTEASTIHRLLGANHQGFTIDTLKGRTIIVDEATMVPTWLMWEIVKRAPTRVILVGDYAQLPPVGAGQPFHDLVHLRPQHVAHLTHCYRATEAIYQAATAIREGFAPSRSERSQSERWHCEDSGTIEQTHEALLAMVRQGEMQFAKGQDVIIAPRNGKRGEWSAGTVRWLNHDIARILIPREDDVFLCVGDRVINTENNPDKDVWNGTTATVADLEPEGAVWIETDQAVRGGEGKLTHSVRLTKGEASKLELGYALTVHKSQGSQYDKVVFVCHRKDAFSLSRSLIYTGVTRAKRECVVLGDYGAMCRGINKVGEKRTVLAHLLGAPA